MRMINCDEHEHIYISDLLVKLHYYIALFYYENMGLDTYTPELRFYAVDRFYYRLCIHMADKYIWGLYP
jgi:hypothetical protein